MDINGKIVTIIPHPTEDAQYILYCGTPDNVIKTHSNPRELSKYAFIHCALKVVWDFDLRKCEL